jgi:hypothetical protein
MDKNIVMGGIVKTNGNGEYCFRIKSDDIHVLNMLKTMMTTLCRDNGFHVVVQEAVFDRDIHDKLGKSEGRMFND